MNGKAPNNNCVAIILAAGLGSRLGRPHPKPLTPLGNGETILSRQLRLLAQQNIPIRIVVGFKMEQIMEAAPNGLFAYNPNYDTTNTAKSLLCGLRGLNNCDVLWLNGDVVFQPTVLDKVLTHGSSVVAVNNARVSEEEVKYTLNNAGYLNAISKSVPDALGEAVGINYITASHLPEFIEKLENVNDSDYFEKAMELLIEKKQNVFQPVDIGEECLEVDFDDDLARAKNLVR